MSAFLDQVRRPRASASRAAAVLRANRGLSTASAFGYIGNRRCLLPTGGRANGAARRLPVFARLPAAIFLVDWAPSVRGGLDLRGQLHQLDGLAPHGGCILAQVAVGPPHQTIVMVQAKVPKLAHPVAPRADRDRLHF